MEHENENDNYLLAKEVSAFLQNAGVRPIICP